MKPVKFPDEQRGTELLRAIHSDVNTLLQIYVATEKISDRHIEKLLKFLCVFVNPMMDCWEGIHKEGDDDTTTSTKVYCLHRAIVTMTFPTISTMVRTPQRGSTPEIISLTSAISSRWRMLQRLKEWSAADVDQEPFKQGTELLREMLRSTCPKIVKC